MPLGGLARAEHLHRRGIVAPTLGVDQEPVGTSPGGGIITSRAGIYEPMLTFPRAGESAPR